MIGFIHVVISHPKFPKNKFIGLKLSNEMFHLKTFFMCIENVYICFIKKTLKVDVVVSCFVLSSFIKKP